MSLRHPDPALPTISILGCGWYGIALAKDLLADGFTVKGSTTRAEKVPMLKQAGVQPFVVMLGAGAASYDPDFFSCDILIISIPPKRAEAASYPAKISEIIPATIRHGVKSVILVSSTGVYGDHNSVVDEDTPPQPDSESGKSLLAAEELVRNQQEFRATVLRFGGLIGEGRDPGRFFAGKKDIPNGRAPVNLIRLKDCVGITRAIISENAVGYTFNACSPEHPEKMDFYTKASLASGLEEPQFIPELTTWKIVSSKYVGKILRYAIGTVWPEAKSDHLLGK